MKSIVIALFVASLLVLSTAFQSFGASDSSSELKPSRPVIKDPKLELELVSTNLQFPTSMSFLGLDDILVLEKNSGRVLRITNGTTFKSPLLDVSVATEYERGMLGIAVSRNVTNDATYVFLYYTESHRDGDDIKNDKKPLGNRLYRYELVDNKLMNPKLLLNLPAEPGPIHNGGKIKIGPDNNIYFTIGDVRGNLSKVQNFQNGTSPDGRGGILRISQEGKPVEGILGNVPPLRLYYAYGIRNSFGIDFDPITDKLWDTENGPAYGDEINLVEPGFNSGWRQVQGLWKPKTFNDHTGPGELLSDVQRLAHFEAAGKYVTPKFIWPESIGVTALEFLSSGKYGKAYQNDLFVGDFHRGNLYHFDLNKSRTNLILNGSLSNGVAINLLQQKDIIFGEGIGAITDLQVGPDGYLYILSLDQGGRSCYPSAPESFECISYSSGVNGSIYRLTYKD